MATTRDDTAFRELSDRLIKDWTDQGYFFDKNPNKWNPVPRTDIPGITLEVPGSYTQVGEQVNAMQDLLPFFTRAIAGQLPTQALGALSASQAVSDPYAQLMTELYAKYGPQLNKIGSDISAQNAKAELASNQALLSGGGLDLLKSLDPEYYATRAKTSSRLGDLMDNIDLSGGLSPTELREIEQGLAREGSARGTYGAPSNTETIANAMTYGQAGRNRQIENQNQLAQAIAASTQFLPASKAGADSFAMATGKTAGANTGESKFTGVNDTAANFGTVSMLGNQLVSNVQNQQNMRAQEKDWLDQFVQFTEGLSNIGNTIGGGKGMMGMCWVAREVYGDYNPRWLEFRHWLLTSAPATLVKLYFLKGERFAKKIRNKPRIKQAIRQWMDTKLGY